MSSYHNPLTEKRVYHVALTKKRACDLVDGQPDISLVPLYTRPDDALLMRVAEEAINAAAEEYSKRTPCTNPGGYVEECKTCEVLDAMQRLDRRAIVNKVKRQS